MAHAVDVGQMLRWTRSMIIANLLPMSKAPYRIALAAALSSTLLSGCLSTAARTASSTTAASTDPRAASSTAAGGPALSPRAPAGLPPVPTVRGAALDVQIRYPSDNQLLTSRDSNFVLGSLGSGDVMLFVNGAPVPVAANGAFLAWLPNPPAVAPQYDVLVARGVDTVRRTIRIRYATRTVMPVDGKLHVDSASLAPAARNMARPDEFVRVSIRAPVNASVWFERADGVRRAMLPLGRTPPTSDAGAVFATEVAARRVPGAHVVAARAGDTVYLALPAIQLTDPESRMVGMLRSASTIGSDTDRVVNARTIPDGTYKWLLMPGTMFEITGKQGGSTRVKLDDALDVWIANEDIVPMPVGTALPRRVTGGLRLTPSPGYVDVAIPLGERPAFLVEPDGSSLVLTLYGVQANPEISPILGNDTLVRRISWDQVSSERVRVTFTLSRPVYGWLVLWDDARRALVLRVRRPPVVDATRPLRGLTIAVDPGHPPAGATGPTGLYEGDAVLPVGALVAQLLRARGATAVMTRTTLAPVGLTERAITARRINAHAFVSIHLNALPDGVNPFTANGTSTLFYHQHSEPLARPVQRELVARFGLRDLGVHYQNLAIARPTWYPSVLTEGLFIMLPEQEAAMRDPAFQLRYAEAIVAGLEQYFRELGQH